jgi:DNA-binding transcriptional regulator LsrR (DeoR family)
MADNDKPRLDDAARAGWLYYIAGKTQDEIAQMLGVSRPTAQRFVSQCRSEGLITFRMNHPIGEIRPGLLRRCSLGGDLAGRLNDRP